MARVAPREKIVVGLMMEGGSWVSMVVTGLAGLWCIPREMWKKKKSFTEMVEYVINDIQTLGGRDVRWTPHF